MTETLLILQTQLKERLFDDHVHGDDSLKKNLMLVEDEVTPCDDYLRRKEMMEKEIERLLPFLYYLTSSLKRSPVCDFQLRIQ